jgi:hypothetical protein
MKIGRIMLTQNGYKEYHTDRYDIFVMGDIYDIDTINEMNVDSKILPYLISVVDSIENGCVDFEKIYGFYKVVITDRKKDIQFFWGDNSGSQRFYINEEKTEVSDSFLYLIRGIGSDKLNMQGVSQLFAYGTIVDGTTIVNGIIKTDSEFYYEVYNGKIICYSKGLKHFCEKYVQHNLFDYVSAECSLHVEKKVSARITGGNDSRTVLSSALRGGYRPTLIITGHLNNPDIPISKKIAKTAGLDLVILDSYIYENEWLKESYEFFDGGYDPVQGYRQMLIVKRLASEADLLLGGVGGEFYKNDYYKAIRYRLLFRKASVDEAIKRVFPHQAENYNWLGSKVRKQAETLTDRLSMLFSERLQMERDNLSLFNHAGYYRIRSSFSDITSSLCREIIQADPLVDPRMIRSIADYHPLKLSMSMWQRTQVHRDYPAFSDIETDKGYSMTVDNAKLLGERIKKGLFWMSRFLNRVREKLGLKWNDNILKYWDEDYLTARDTDEWRYSFEICKKHGIIDMSAQEADIPLRFTGYIILMGLSIYTMESPDGLLTR